MLSPLLDCICRTVPVTSPPQGRVGEGASGPRQSQQKRPVSLPRQQKDKPPAAQPQAAQLPAWGERPRPVERPLRQERPGPAQVVPPPPLQQASVANPTPPVPPVPAATQARPTKPSQPSQPDRAHGTSSATYEVRQLPSSTLVPQSRPQSSRQPPPTQQRDARPVSQSRPAQAQAQAPSLPTQAPSQPRQAVLAVQTMGPHDHARAGGGNNGGVRRIPAAGSVPQASSAQSRQLAQSAQVRDIARDVWQDAYATPMSQAQPPRPMEAAPRARGGNRPQGTQGQSTGVRAVPASQVRAAEALELSDARHRGSELRSGARVEVARPSPMLASQAWLHDVYDEGLDGTQGARGEQLEYISCMHHSFSRG